MCQGHHTEVCGHTVFRPFEVTKMESDDEMITVDCSSNSSDSGVNSGPGKLSLLHSYPSFNPAHLSKPLISQI